MVCVVCLLKSVPFPLSDVKHRWREIGRSSLVAVKWADLYFGSFPVKFPGD